MYAIIFKKRLSTMEPIGKCVDYRPISFS